MVMALAWEEGLLGQCCGLFGRLQGGSSPLLFRGESSPDGVLSRGQGLFRHTPRLTLFDRGASSSPLDPGLADDAGEWRAGFRPFSTQAPRSTAMGTAPSWFREPVDPSGEEGGSPLMRCRSF